jgi:hypothetical protein
MRPAARVERARRARPDSEHCSKYLELHCEIDDRTDGYACGAFG